MVPTIYHHHPHTGEFMGNGEPDPSPLEEGVWLYPDNCTETTPPPDLDGQARVWTGEQWEYSPDHRGETWWSGPNQPVVVAFLGSPTEHDLVPENPYVEPEPSNSYRPLSAYQFWAAIRAKGYEPAVQAWVETIVDPEQKGISSAALEFSQRFERTQPMVEALRGPLGMTEQQLDAFWLWAASL